MKNISKILASLILTASVVPVFVFAQNSNDARFWEIQSVDTMKYSRDLAREKLNDRNFDKTIGSQVKAIADTGATHITVATPYDAEFRPYLNKWVSLARKHNLKVWFRGNFSGWEGWFDYKKINRDEHAVKTKEFILNNRDLFEDGDIFTACPECENGGPGDPRITRDIEGHRKFLIKEHGIMSDAFKEIDRNVIFNYNSMNGDVAFLIMDKATTDALGGIISVDHYVKTKERLISDIRKLSRQGGGARIVLGETGVPIPDIHGNMSAIDQAKWMQDALVELAKTPEVEAVNYWVNIGGSTQLWDSKLNPRPIVGVLNNFYKPKQITGYVTDELDRPVKDVVVSNEYGSVLTKGDGSFSIPYISYLETNLKFEKNEFHPEEMSVGSYDGKSLEITLKKGRESWAFRFLKNLRQMANLLVSIF